MKRLVIIAILIVGGVLIFTRDKAPDMDKTNETVSEKTEVVDTKEESKEEVEVVEPKEEVAKEEEVVTKEVVEEPVKEKEVVEVKEEVKEVIKPKITTIVPLKPALVKAPVVTIPVIVSNVKVYLYDFNIDVSQKEVSAGKINFEVMNNGRFSHDFAIANYKNFGKVRPGETKNFSALLNSGEAKIYSDRNQDAEKGMVETIILQ